MFASFLFPYKRHNRAMWTVQTPYVRFFYMQLGRFRPDEICFIGNQEHFDHIERHAEKNYAFVNAATAKSLGYRVPSNDEIDSASRYVIDDSIFEPLEKEFGHSKNLVFKHLLTNRYGPLESELHRIFFQISRAHPLEGIISLCNCPSLDSVASQFRTRVIYNENGPLRAPFFSPTCYFDSHGVNGNTESYERYRVFRKSVETEKVPIYSRPELLSIMTASGFQEDASGSSLPGYKLGLSLQVEDDSNILAFANGFSNLDLIFLAREYFGKDEILIRKHPCGHLSYDDLGVKDNSPGPLDFIRSCDAVLTINSSMGLEALLHGKKVYMLGDNPAAFMALNGIHDTSYRYLSEDELLMALNFFVFGYLVPYEFLFDPEYLRWRLGNPSEPEIYQRHLCHYLHRKGLTAKPSVAAATKPSGPSSELAIVNRKHFGELTSTSEARALFASSVRMIEIEVFSYCNRRCWFCPNATIDRRSRNEIMDESLYCKILHELREIDCDKIVTYSRYNEPLADRPLILRRIGQAREAIPKACLHTNTNGDYLTRDYLDELYQAGLNSLNIQAYPDVKCESWDDAVKSAIRRKVSELDLECEFVIQNPGEWHEARLSYRDMSLKIYGRNFRTNGNNRGGLVENIEPFERLCPCLRPFNNFNIDYNGNVMPCCNLRSDAPEHRKYIVGNIAENTVYQIYTNDKLVSWRRHLISFGLKKSPATPAVSA